MTWRRDDESSCESKENDTESNETSTEKRNAEEDESVLDGALQMCESDCACHWGPKADSKEKSLELEKERNVEVWGNWKDDESSIGSTEESHENDDEDLECLFGKWNNGFGFWNHKSFGLKECPEGPKQCWCCARRRAAKQRKATDTLKENNSDEGSSKTKNTEVDYDCWEKRTEEENKMIDFDFENERRGNRLWFWRDEEEDLEQLFKSNKKEDKDTNNARNKNWRRTASRWCRQLEKDGGTEASSEVESVKSNDDDTETSLTEVEHVQWTETSEDFWKANTEQMCKVRLQVSDNHWWADEVGSLHESDDQTLEALHEPLEGLHAPLPVLWKSKSWGML